VTKGAAARGHAQKKLSLPFLKRRITLSKLETGLGSGQPSSRCAREGGSGIRLNFSFINAPQVRPVRFPALPWSGRETAPAVLRRPVCKICIAVSLEPAPLLLGFWATPIPNALFQSC